MDKQSHRKRIDIYVFLIEQMKLNFGFFHSQYFVTTCAMNEIDNLNFTFGLKWTTQRYQFSTLTKKSSNIQKLNDKKTNK